MTPFAGHLGAQGGHEQLAATQDGGADDGGERGSHGRSDRVTSLFMAAAGAESFPDFLDRINNALCACRVREGALVDYYDPVLIALGDAVDVLVAELAAQRFDGEYNWALLTVGCSSEWKPRFTLYLHPHRGTHCFAVEADRTRKYVAAPPVIAARYRWTVNHELRWLPDVSELAAQMLRSVRMSVPPPQTNTL